MLGFRTEFLERNGQRGTVNWKIATIFENGKTLFTPRFRNKDGSRGYPSEVIEARTLLVWETSVSMSKLPLTIHRILRTTTLHSWWLTSKCPICTREALCWPGASFRSRLNMLCHSECFPTTTVHTNPGICRKKDPNFIFFLLAQLCRHRDKKVLSSHC